MIRSLGAAGLLALSLAPAPALACASCGCTLTADWLTQGLVSQPGTTLALRYDFIPQTSLQSGTRRIRRSTIALPTDREIERYTYNHYVTLSADRQFASDWGVSAQLPFVFRPHATISEGDTAPSESRTRGVGDLRITARWQGLSGKDGITGLQFGLVLPTGRVHQDFRRGPEAGGEVDRGLQPGAGSVQPTIGAYRYGRLSPTLDYILQAQGQIAGSGRDHYRPGAQGELVAGLQYTGWREITPQLQLDFRASARDRGTNADRPNSGGEQLYVAPGLIVPLGSGLSAFGYAQVPVYARVNGYQIVPRVVATFGVQYRL